MNATDFANFFDFCIERKGSESTYDNTYDVDYNYIVWDLQGVFQSRFIDDVSELVECFDSMLPDYLTYDLEDELGFEYDSDSDKYYMEQAKEFIETECPEYVDTDIYDIICCYIDPSLIIDDVDDTFDEQ